MSVARLGLMGPPSAPRSSSPSPVPLVVHHQSLLARTVVGTCAAYTMLYGIAIPATTAVAEEVMMAGTFDPPGAVGLVAPTRLSPQPHSAGRAIT